MSGSGGGTNTIQSATPWSGEQPALANLYNQIMGYYPQGAFAPNGYNTGQVIGLNNQQQSALNSMNGGGNQDTWVSNYFTTQLANGNWSQEPGAQGLSDIANGTGVASPASAIANGNFSNAPGLGALQAMAQGNFSGSGAGNLTNLAGGNFTGAGFGNLANLANGNFSGASPLSTLENYANGSMLGSANNAAQQLYSAESQPIMNQFNTSTLPQLLSAFSSAGRLGSGANALQLNNATQGLGTSLGNLAQSTMGTNYEQQIQNQLTAANQLGGLQSSAAGTLAGLQSGAAQSLGSLQSGAAQSLANNQTSVLNNLLGIQGSANNNLANLQGSALSNLNNMGWNQIAQQLSAGNQIQAQQQAQTNAAIAQSNYGLMQPYTSLANYAGLLSGLPASGMGTTSTTQSNPLASLMGLGLTGGSLYSMLGGGGLLGGLGGGAAAGIGAGTFALPAAMLASTAIPTAGTSALMGLGAMGALAL